MHMCGIIIVITLLLCCDHSAAVMKASLSWWVVVVLLFGVFAKGLPPKMGHEVGYEKEMGDERVRDPILGEHF